MEHRKTGNNAKEFPGKTAVDILSFVLETKSSHYSIERFYKNLSENNSRLNELQWGTCNDDVEQAVEFVLSDGVDINARASDNDYTALLWASCSSSSQFIETLIDLGADVNAQRKDDKVTPLILAIEWNNYMAACLPLRHGADVDVQGGDGFTPLHFAVSKGHENLCRLLLEHNADVNIRDKNGDTPLHLCVREGNESLCRLLLEHNNANVHFGGKDGDTPLHLCVREGNENLSRLLLEHNAMQRHPKFELSSAQKTIETKYTTGVASVQGAVKLKSNLQREKTLGQNPSYTHTTLETVELWENPKGTIREPEAKQVKTLAVRHPKSKATTSSRTNK